MEQLLQIVLLGIISSALVYFYFSIYQEYCQDRTRQELFHVRNELFDFAAAGGISFDAPAYRYLRDYINGMIGFIHRLDVVHIIALSFVKSPTHIPKLKDVLGKIEDETAKEELKKISLQVHLIAFTHLTRTSILFVFIALLFTVFFLCKQLWIGLKNRVLPHGWKNLKSTVADQFPGFEQMEELTFAENH